MDESNVIKIRRGEGIPNDKVLRDYELGYSIDYKTLFINDNGTVRPVQENITYIKIVYSDNDDDWNYDPSLKVYSFSILETEHKLGVKAYVADVQEQIDETTGYSKILFNANTDLNGNITVMISKRATIRILICGCYINETRAINFSYGTTLPQSGVEGNIFFLTNPGAGSYVINAGDFRDSDTGLRWYFRKWSTSFIELWLNPTIFSEDSWDIDANSGIIKYIQDITLPQDFIKQVFYSAASVNKLNIMSSSGFTNTENQPSHGSIILYDISSSELTDLLVSIHVYGILSDAQPETGGIEPLLYTEEDNDKGGKTAFINSDT